MTQSITVKPNQSLSDVILQACGTMEAGMQFVADNGVPVSQILSVNEKFQITDAATALADPETLQYLQTNQIVIGTLGNLGAETIYIPEGGGDGYIPEDGDGHFISE